jgi:DNA-binding LacI/PurR family transcriptional regulator
MTTIRDVAKYAGVSPITVSRVVNDADNVNPGTRSRVEKAILELGYFPNLAARSLRSKQTYTIALIFPDVTSAFLTTIARGVEDAAQGAVFQFFCATRMKTPKNSQNISIPSSGSGSMVS